MSYYPPRTYVAAPPPPQSSTAHLVIAWVVAICTFGYLLPWAIAATRNKSDVVAIALINLFLGWSLVGWVVALVMACTTDPKAAVVVVNAPAPYPYPPPHWQQQPTQFGRVPQWETPPHYGPSPQYAPPTIYGTVSEPTLDQPFGNDTLPLASGQPSFDPGTIPEDTRQQAPLPYQAPSNDRRE